MECNQVKIIAQDNTDFLKHVLVNVDDHLIESISNSGPQALKVFTLDFDKDKLQHVDLEVIYLIIKDYVKRDLWREPMIEVACRYFGINREKWQFSLSQKIRDFEAKDLKTVSSITGVKPRTIHSWFASRPLVLHSMLEFTANAMKKPIFNLQFSTFNGDLMTNQQTTTEILGLFDGFNKSEILEGRGVKLANGEILYTDGLKNFIEENNLHHVEFLDQLIAFIESETQHTNY